MFPSLVRKTFSEWNLKTIISHPRTLKKNHTRENRLQNSSKCVLVNFCTSCLDRLLIEYYNFEIFSTMYWKFLTLILTTVHTHVYKYGCFSVPKQDKFRIPLFVSKQGEAKINKQKHTLPIRLFRNKKKCVKTRIL